MAEQKELPCLKIFYTSVTSNTFYLVYLECSKGNILTMVKLYNVKICLHNVIVGFLSGILVKEPAGSSPAKVLTLFIVLLQTGETAGSKVFLRSSQKQTIPPLTLTHTSKCTQPVQGKKN